MSRITRKGFLVRHGTWLDKLIRLIPVQIGHYELVRIGKNFDHSRYNPFVIQKKGTK